MICGMDASTALCIHVSNRVVLVIVGRDTLNWTLSPERGCSDITVPRGSRSKYLFRSAVRTSHAALGAKGRQLG